MTVQLQSLPAYYAALMAADFDFEASDDYEMYCRGRDEVARLRAQADASGQHRALFEAFDTHWDAKARHIYNRGVTVPPLPERPVEASV